MNQIVQSAVEITLPTFTGQKFTSKAQKLKSMLTRILSGLVKSLKASRIDDSPTYEIFIKENLLDKNLGPEIARTLR